MTGISQPLANISSGLPVFVLILVFFLVSACSRAIVKTSPSIELGTAFHHVVLNKFDNNVVQAPLRIYIEGDGRPFIGDTGITRDPTPRYAPVMGLWKMDPGNALYVGRPCYLGAAKLPECNQRVWTSGRYNRFIVESMQAIVERHSGGRPVVLIGHSGGGALAMLIANRMSTQPGEVAAVVTLSGNLDVAGWVKFHGYSALDQSDNPADKLPLVEHIMQLHVIAGRDNEIPPDLTRNLKNRLPAGSICEVPTYDHNCCWNHRWLKFLRTLEKQLLTRQADSNVLCAVFAS